MGDDLRPGNVKVRRMLYPALMPHTAPGSLGTAIDAAADVAEALVIEAVQQERARIAREIEQIAAITRVAREGKRHGVTQREAELYDKGFDDAIRFVAERLPVPECDTQNDTNAREDTE